MFCGLRESFDRVPRKVLEWALRNKGIPDVLVRSVMSLYEGARTTVRVDSELLQELEVKVEMHQESVLSPFHFAFVVDVVARFSREGVLSELLFSDSLVLMSDAIEGLTDEFLKWKEAFENKGLKVNFVKIKLIVCSGITQDGKVRLIHVVSTA